MTPGVALQGVTRGLPLRTHTNGFYPEDEKEDNLVRLEPVGGPGLVVPPAEATAIRRQTVLRLIPEKFASRKTRIRHALRICVAQKETEKYAARGDGLTGTRCFDRVSDQYARTSSG